MTKADCFEDDFVFRCEPTSNLAGRVQDGHFAVLDHPITPVVEVHMAAFLARDVSRNTNERILLGDGEADVDRVEVALNRAVEDRVGSQFDERRPRRI